MDLLYKKGILSFTAFNKENMMETLVRFCINAQPLKALRNTEDIEKFHYGIYKQRNFKISSEC